MGIAIFAANFFTQAGSNLFAQESEVIRPPQTVADDPAKHDSQPQAVSFSNDSTSAEKVERPLEVAELEDMATTNNPTMAQAAARVRALQGKYVQAGLYRNPVMGYEAEEIGDEGRAGQHGIFFGQRFITGGKLGLSRAVASQEIERARHELEMQQLRVVNAVRTKALETIVAQRAVALNQQLVEIGKAGAQAARDLQQGKEVGQVDVLQARVELNSAILGLRNAQNEHVAAWRRLAIVVGMPEMTLTPLADDVSETVPELSWGDTLSQLLAQSPEMTRAWARVKQAEYALARARAARVPDIDLETAVRHNTATDYTTASLALGIPLQIFDRNQGNILKASAELSAAQRNVRRVELALQDRLAEAFMRYANARQQAGQYKSHIIPDAEASLELVRKGYKLGEFTYLDLLTAQRT
jgi:cobalt-zinc-cadmium efflux system outer membrane protein